MIRNFALVLAIGTGLFCIIAATLILFALGAMYVVMSIQNYGYLPVLSVLVPLGTLSLWAGYHLERGRE